MKKGMFIKKVLALMILICLVFLLAYNIENGKNTDISTMDVATSVTNDSNAGSINNNDTNITTGSGATEASNTEASNTEASNTEASNTEASNIKTTDNGDTNIKDTVTENINQEQTIEQQADLILSKMTLEEKIYQMFVITPEALTEEETVTSAGDITKNALEKFPVGGLVYFAKNIVDANQLTSMLRNTQDYANEAEGMVVFTCIDEEGGKIARIGNNSAFHVKTFTDMVSIKDTEKAYEVGTTIASYLKTYGFNVDFAPDADVLTNPENTVIGSRSFGSDPVRVTDMALAVAKGLKDNGIIATFKHFPGHGGTLGDTHEGFAYTNKTYEELQQSELVPFAAASNSIDMIMVAHISVPNIIGDNTPSSLSKKMVTDILKNDLNFSGLVITDALNMGAITDKYTSAQAAVMAVEAGDDLLLMPENFKEATDALISAVRNNEISESQIDESVRKIIKAKLSIN